MKVNSVSSSEYFKVYPDNIITFNCYAMKDMIVSGLTLVKKMYHEIDENLLCDLQVVDGEKIVKNQLIFSLKGNVNSLIAKESEVLNLLKLSSTISTNTNQTISRVNKYQTKILFYPLDLMHKNAIINGGGITIDNMLDYNLFIKNHHLAFIKNLEQLIQEYRLKYGKLAQIALEVNSLEQFKEINSIGIDVIILKDLSLELIQICVNLSKNKSILMATGLPIDELKSYVKVGLDYILLDSIYLVKDIIDFKVEYII